MSLKYRPDIDGLRTVAVVAVILFHAEFLLKGKNIFSGGYLGVDVFFVISGYLITLILLKENSKQSFSIYNFYARRIRRILPALLTVFLISVPFAWNLLRPEELKQSAVSILSSLLFVSNIFFKNNTGYWDTSASEMPFLHTWSLSVEEQFYIFFPLLLTLLYRLKMKPFWVILGGSFISLVASQVASTQWPDANFFLMPFRAWEIGAGSLVACLHFNKPTSWRPGNQFLSMAAFFAILVSFYLFDDKTPHPSLLTLVPVLASAYLIFNRSGEGWVYRLLSSKIFVSIGLISYGMYLWHFPIFAFSNIYYGEVHLIVKFISIAVTFALSTILFFAIENPLRRIRTQIFFPVLVMALLVVFAFNLFFIQSDGASSRLKELEKIVDIKYWKVESGNREKFETHQGCWAPNSRKPYVEDPFKKCKSQEALASKDLIMVIGDSNVASLIPGLQKVFGKERIVQRVLNSCLPAEGLGSKVCQQTLKNLAEEARELEPSLILIGGRYLKPHHPGRVKKYIENNFKGLKSRVVLVGPLPRWPGMTRYFINSYHANPINFSIPKWRVPLGETFDLEANYLEVAKALGVAYLSPVSTFCQGGKCLLKVGNRPDEITTWDYGHLTEAASTFLIEKNRQFLNDQLIQADQ